MDVIFFTKFLKGLSSAEVGARVRSLGFDGLDLAVRAGQCVQPEDVAQTLPAAMTLWRDMGLSVPLVSLETRPTDPQHPLIHTLYAACGAAGIPFIKLGYWPWQAGQDYWAQTEAIRCQLESFAELGARHGVCSLLHTHSGLNYGGNASAALSLVRGLDSQHIGVYLDPAHLSLDGEPLPLALAITGGYLKMVAVKAARYVPRADTGGWRREWCLLSDGLVDWPHALQQFREAGYTGSFTMHGEYSATEETDGVLKLVAQDIAFLRQMGKV